MPHWLSEMLVFVAVVFVLLVVNIYYETHRRESERELLEKMIERLDGIDERLGEIESSIQDMQIPSDEPPTHN